MGLWRLLLKRLFPTREEMPHEDFGLSIFQENGVDMFSLACWEEKPRDFSLWLEIWQALMAGRACLTCEESRNCVSRREVKRKTEIIYEETFAMHFGREHPDDSKTHTRLTDGWKEIYSVGTGIDRQMLAAKYLDYAEERYGPWNGTTTLYALKNRPACRTLEEAKACIKQPGLFSAYYDIDEDWLDITLPDEKTREFVLKTIRGCLDAHGKTLWVQGQEA